MTAAIFPPSIFASSPFPKRSEEHSFQTPCSGLCPMYHPPLSRDPVCRLKYVIGLSRFMSPCSVSYVIYVLHHTPLRKKKN